MGDWPFGPEQAARVIASVSWPNERVENRDAWATKMLTDSDLLEREAERAIERLYAAINRVGRMHDHTTPSPAVPDAPRTDQKEAE